jgi:exopolysaccharide biosynthesis polyprenyl glycosylphosphotransferase
VALLASNTIEHGQTAQQLVAAVERTRWPDATPLPAVLRRPLHEVAAEVVVQPRPRISLILKRVFDILGSALGLIVLSPVLVVIAVAVRTTSRGPSLFVQDRCGLKGKVFRFYKFRTMVVDAEQRRAEVEHLNEMCGPAFKIRRDPRITGLGAVLRRSSLDELPQLWNVLKGDMSLVGPRPPLPDEVERYNSRQAQRLSVPPGITGLWQVSGRSLIPDFETWLALDLDYARRWSLWLDTKILVKTVVVVASGRGAE